MKTETFEIPLDELGDEFLDMPDGVTNYERQEINRCYRNALRYGREIVNGIAFDLGTTTDAGRGRVPDARPMANDAQRMGQYIAARAELYARIDGVMHRLAMNEKGAEVSDG